MATLVATSTARKTAHEGKAARTAGSRARGLGKDPRPLPQPEWLSRLIECTYTLPQVDELQYVGLSFL